MKRVFLLLSILFFNIGIIFSQNNVNGVLVDSLNNEKLPFVNVGLMRAVDSIFVSGTSSNEDGQFKLEHVPSGKYIFFVSSIGYESVKKMIDVSADLDLGVIKMKAGSTRLEDVVVVEKRPLFSNEGEKTLYNVSEDPSVQTGTVSDALQNAPGVEVDVEGNVTLRGVSSVEVWINGQPSNLNEENLKTYLQQMPANALERIEVITNPSARYSSNSDGGIINIVTNAKIKKNQFISFGLRASSAPNASPWVSYVWANEKMSLNFFLNANYSQWKNYNNGYSTSFDNNLDTTNYTSYEGESFSNNFGGGFNINFDYNIDTMNTIGVWIGGWPHANSSDNFQETFRHEYMQDAGMYHYTTEGTSKGLNQFYHAGLQYMHKFNNEGHNISLRMNGNLSNGYSNQYNKRTYETQTWMNVDYQELSEYNDFGYGLNLDYSLPYSDKGEIGIGTSYSYSPDNYYVDYDTLAGDVYVKDVMRSFNREVGSHEYDVYFTLQQKWGNFVFKPGIRMEYEKVWNNISGYEVSEHEKDYLNWRPSVHLSYRTKSMHNFSLSYSRRIAPPRARDLTNYKFYSTESFSTGNLELVPTYTNSIEGGWTKYWERFGSLGLTAYYRDSKNTVDNISDVILDDYFGRYVQYSYPVNVGRSSRTGLEANVTYRPTAMFNMRLYANVYDYYFETKFNKNGEIIKDNSIVYSVRLNLWTKLWNKLEIHASGNYRSPQQSLFAERHANYSINCGLRADFFDRKMSVHINVNDIFNWNKWDNNVTNPYYQSYSSFKYNSRSISAGLVFRFGKMELERKAQTGGGEMQNPAMQ
ncbi:MAG: TonB-dependent receptor [Lentimicrobiaceae bacterium]|nr:TonB-dependent receptor [Lentimicrobiaceae bacterium]